MKAASQPAATSRRGASPRKHDLTGREFFRITVRREAEPRRKPSGKPVRRWVCVCACGPEKEFVVLQGNLLRGHTKSCGCWNLEQAVTNNTTHGLFGTMIFNEWQGIKQRTGNPNHPDWLRYGGRGITFWPAWSASCESFRAGVLAECGRLPGPGESIDRIDNSRGYVPGNIRIATAKKQARNRRSNRPITFNGETLLLVEWSERTGIAHSTIISRLDRYGWSITRALTTPVR